MSVRRNGDNPGLADPGEGVIEVRGVCHMTIIRTIPDVQDPVLQVELLGDVTRGDPLAKVGYSFDVVHARVKIAAGRFRLVGRVALPLQKDSPGVKEISGILLNAWNRFQALIGNFCW